ncbi:2328_t:CDS:2 [Funneliformis geosporum]|uniref:2328_t:CDS:1 n=1 Tax=Funneliformis geosporum TaxID=1117311 RepID=A0A9W4T3R8_9GLOM|nr:2328_t:CDS:2 [Funneliformis geosporum]
MDQDEKKTKNQEQALANQGKVIEELSQTNKKLQAEETKQNKNLEKLDDKIEHREKEIEEATKKDGVVDAIKKIKEQIANNNKNISSIGSGSSNKDKHPIMEFLTLENILIGFAIYALWQIVKDNKRDDGCIKQIKEDLEKIRKITDLEEKYRKAHLA